MRDWLVHIRRNEYASLQTQIREALVAAILDGQLARDEPVPSTRKMAKSLGVSRNTVVLAYQNLLDDGYLAARERSGYYVADKTFVGAARPRKSDLPPPKTSKTGPDWKARLVKHPSAQKTFRSRSTGTAIRILSSMARSITTSSRLRNGATVPARRSARNGLAPGPTTPGRSTTRCSSNRSAGASCQGAASWRATMKS